MDEDIDESDDTGYRYTGEEDNNEEKVPWKLETYSRAFIMLKLLMFFSLTGAYKI